MKNANLITVWMTSVFLVSNSAVAQSAPAEQQTQAPAPVIQQPQENKPRVGQIDPAEKDKYKTRFESKDSRIFGFAAAHTEDMANSNVLYSIVMGYEWQVGANGGIPAETMFVFGEKTFYVDAGLGFKHYFSDEDFSPFAKGTVGIGAATFNDSERINGFAYRISGGVTFFRTSTKHLELSASFGSIMKQSSLGTPKVLSFGVAVLY